ncbi:MAG: hypothetical protein Q8941_12185 [Bacteroidota bacterium]|nr:hypothetical protein [Bacteroidota bacterium]
MKYVLALLFVFSFTAGFAQRVPRKSKESRAYHDYRLKPTVPPYGLVKIKALIQKIKSDEEDNEALSPKLYEALSFREKFTYNMIHAESYSQNCDYMPPQPNEQIKIFAYIPDAFNEFQWSDRQLTFLATNRDSVIALMEGSITRSKRVGVNFKHAILEINAKEMIPFLITIYKGNKTMRDLDILTLFLQMMKENEYGPFIVSGSYRKLYSDESSYRSYLNYNQANEDLIIKRAMDFYNATKK